MHILEEWRIRDIEQKVDRVADRLYQLDTLHSNVASMEHSSERLGSQIDGLRSEFEACSSRFERIEQ